MRIGKRLVAAATLALGTTVVLAPASLAEQVESDHYTVTDSHIEQEAHEGFCPDVPFLVLWEAQSEGFFHGVRRGDGLVYYADHFRATETYTNLDNGKTLTIESVTNNTDQDVTDNGDGTLTIAFKSTGRNFVYGPDGTRLFVDVGQFRGSILIDDGGTPGDPSDDEFLEYLGDDKQVGHWDTADRDFCADVLTFLS